MTTPSSPPSTSLPQEPHWSNDDPATPALIPYVFADVYDEPYKELSPDEFPTYQKALAAAREYCAMRIRLHNTELCEAMTIAEMAGEPWHFLAGYMAATSGKTRILGGE